VKYGKWYSVGKLDASGNFLPDRQGVDVGGGPFSAADRFPGTLINGSAGPVYEYRSGRLILGELDEDGNFIPDLRGKILAFKDYRPGKDVPRIYNLPGKFVKKASKEEKQP
jgi:hypothetical protein